MKKIIFSILVASVFSSCAVHHKAVQQKVSAVNSLKYLGGYEVPYNTQYKGTTVGGLSGIDYDKVNNVYYIISDDRSQINSARFYTAKIDINENGIKNVDFINVTTLLQPNGASYPDRKKDPAHSPDPEAIRYNPVTKDLIWTSEGERITGKETVIEQPAITTIDKSGRYKDTFTLPVQMHIYPEERGIRQNGVFEGLTFAENFKKMFVSVEEPLYEDGPRAGLRDTITWTRIIKYDVSKHQPIAQYAYHLEPVAHPSIPENEFKINGIPDILSISKDKLLVIERSFSTGIPACTIRIFIMDIEISTDISGVPSLLQQSSFIPASKKLLLNMDNLGIYIDNIEGVTFGPDLANGHKTLIFVSDNNFDKHQKTQFLLFEVD